ncbi:hypothetical protein [Desulfurobacterium sp.]
MGDLTESLLTLDKKASAIVLSAEEAALEEQELEFLSTIKKLKERKTRASL